MMDDVKDIVLVVASAFVFCFLVFSLKECTMHRDELSAKQTVHAQYSDEYIRTPAQPQPQAQ